MVNLPLQDNTHTAHVEIGVRPAQRRQGIGAALYDAVLALVRDARPDHRHGVDGPAGRAARGPGHARRDDRRRTRRGRRPPVTRFLLQRGFALEQVERYSVFDLPFDADLVAKHRAEAEAHAGPDYRLVTWHEPRARTSGSTSTRC